MASYKLGFIVCAEDERHAKEVAKSLLGDICSEGHGFEYGSIGSAIPADSPKGKEVIAQILAWMVEGFQLDLITIREVLKHHTDDEILSGECRATSAAHDRCAVTTVRHHMHCLGMHVGPSVRLYDRDGNGIRNRSELDEALNQSDSKVHVVTANAHS
jgi:hypothetical protein